jgi:hypothetical protein
MLHCPMSVSKEPFSHIKAFNNPHASLGLGRWARKSKEKRNPDLSTRSTRNPHH